MIIQVQTKHPEHPAVLRYIDANLYSLQAIVGGYIETLTVGHEDGVDVILICNEEGKLRGMPENFWYRGDCIVGPVIFAGAKDGEIVDLPESWRWEQHNRKREVGLDV